jgi:muconolactone delta-isomerase
MPAGTGLGDGRHAGVHRGAWPAVKAGEEARVGEDADLRLFLVEHDLHGLSPGQLAAAHQVLEEAVSRELQRGSQIRYLQRIVAAHEGRCLSLFQACGPEAVRSVNDIAQFPLTHIVAVTSAVPRSHRRKARPGEGDLDDRTRLPGAP